VDNWAVSPHATPIPANDPTAMPALHIYDFFAGVQGIPSGPALIPATGLTLIQAICEPILPIWGSLYEYTIAPRSEGV
jgi:hypothetical protein